VKKVLITGATGFIGTRLCEVMILTGRWKPRLFVHSTASASRIARFPIDFVLGDLCDKNSVDRAIEECDAVVHLARGDRRVMTTGLENVLRAALKQRCERFVHLSSVAVYGQHPPPESSSEEAPPQPGDMPYGVEKLKEEQRVRRFGRGHGLPFVILRPPNVYGPFSHFTVNLIGKIRAGQIAIIDSGQNPCNLVYVDNLVEAILLSLWKPAAIGETFFVTDCETVSWERCLNDLAALVGKTLPHVSRANLVSLPRERLIWDSLRSLRSVLFSEEVRRELRKLPLIKSFENTINEKMQHLSTETQHRLRIALAGPLIFQKNGTLPPQTLAADDPLIAVQSRTVSHSSDKAKRLLGYSSPISYRDGMTLTETWLRHSQLV
jgi:nucleoside-diphosphate-sugar epimerase